jgi:hypothetical protein
MRYLKSLTFLCVLSSLLVISACGDAEVEEEDITREASGVSPPAGCTPLNSYNGVFTTNSGNSRYPFKKTFTMDGGRTTKSYIYKIVDDKIVGPTTQNNTCFKYYWERVLEMQQYIRV